MKAMQLLWLVGAAAFVGACDFGTDTSKDQDSGADSGDTDQDTDTDTDTTGVVAWNDNITAANFVDCAGSSVTFSAETIRWGGDVEVYLSQTDYFGEFRGWDENHTMDEVDHSSNESGYSKYERELSTGATLDSQEEDVSTLWKCDGDSAIIDPGNARFEVTFALAVWAPGDDSASDAPADCVVFGNDPDYLLTDPTANDQPNVPSWLTDANCRAL